MRIEENHKKNEMRKFFEGIKNTRQQGINTPILVKGSDGNIISPIEQVLYRWREYFCETRNLSDSSVEQILIEEIINDNPEVDTPSYNEICYIINNLKTNKAARSDNIPPELIKNGDRTLKKTLHKLILNIWDNEDLPDQWNEGIICPIFKKGDRPNCEHYRPITLLNIAYKIYAILLNNRLVKIVGKQLSDTEMGFRPNRSNIDNIFIIRQVFEKCHEFNVELHNIFIDYSRAFDSVYRNKIIECLLECGVPTKLIKLISLTLIDTKEKIKVNNSLSNDFKVEFGVRQGDPLATLYSVAIDSILKQLDIRGNISTRLKQCITYADDILITAWTKQAAANTFEKLKN
jgi:sorting nexin-29